MAKVSVEVNNNLCPQTLYVYGTRNEDGRADFGLFCWISYCWLDQLGVMCAIGGRKATLANIRRNRVFSANLVSEAMLPLADYFGTADGRDADKMDVPVRWERGAVLDVPVLADSPLSFELEVEREIATNDEDGTVFLCHIRNTLEEAALADPALTAAERLRMTAAVRTTGDEEYWAWDGRHLGHWHEPAQKIRPGVEIGAAARGE